MKAESEMKSGMEEIDAMKKFHGNRNAFVLRSGGS